MQFPLDLRQSLVLVTLTCLGVSSTIGQDTWEQWRGPTRDCHVSGVKWPATIDEAALTKTWTKPLGPSYSGPIVTKNRVFTTSTKDSAFEVVRAFDRKSGEELWATQWEGTMRVPFFAASNGSWIRATPAYSEGLIYVAGMKDVLVCLRGEDGEIVWSVDFPKKIGSAVPSFGFVSSPLVHGKFVYVQAGGGVTKLDKLTGEIAWQSLKDGGGMSGGAFSSPLIATLGGKEQLVVQSRTKLGGLDLETGSELWSQAVPAFRGMNILTPTVIDDNIFTSTYGGKTFLFVTANQNGKLTPTEVWNQKAQGYMSSPVVVDNHVYLHLKNARFTCINLATGKETWTTKPYGKYWSMIVNGGRMLALDQRGELLYIKANPEKFELLGSRKLTSQETWAHIAIAGDQIFIREQKALTAYRWR